MKLLLILSVLVVVASAISLDDQWQQFKLNHGKTYKSLLEEKRRFAIFKNNVIAIEQHNERYASGKETFSKGINQFTDMTEEELQSTLSPIPPRSTGKVFEIFNETGIIGNELVNWVYKGVVSPVKNQGSCGGCWAFSTVGSIEGQIAIASGAIVSLSPQMLIDCSRTHNTGCNGGRTDWAFDDIKTIGVVTEEEYPFVGSQGRCKKQGAQKVSGYKEVRLDEEAILKALTAVGPLSIAMDSTYLHGYSGGIFNLCQDTANHAVLLVGAGVEDGQDYWLIKNSWGESWGEAGYFKIPRGQKACAILTSVTYPTL